MALYGREKISVIFSDKPIQPSSNEIVIHPSNESWNDFGFKIHCVCKIGLSGVTYDQEIYLSFLQDNSNETKSNSHSETIDLKEWLADQDADAPIPKKFAPEFFTLLPNMQAYRYLVDKFGPNTAKNILEELNDLVLHNKIAKSRSWIDRAQSSMAFSLGFMRNSEPFFALHNAYPILNGLEEELHSSISSSLLVNFKLDGFSNSHELALKYSPDSIIPKRINILIGKNGLGKSQCLNTFCRSALRYKGEKSKLTDPEHKRPMINRLLAIGTPGETSNTFPPERQKTQKLFYRRLNLTRNGSSRTSSTTQLLKELARSKESMRNQSRWEIFLSALNSTINVDNITVRLKDGSWKNIEEFERGSGEQRSLEFFSEVDTKTEPHLRIKNKSFPLSSGQLTFLKFSLLCSLYIENGSFVLMDEPETHLHPNLISAFVDLLDTLLEETNSYALIATHSVFFVREISRDQVHVFKEAEDDGISIVNPRLRTFGADIDSISEFVFEDGITNRLAVKVADRVADKRFEEVDRLIGDEISLSALMSIRDKLEGRNQ